jgi:hypothetical protein
LILNLPLEISCQQGLSLLHRFFNASFSSTTALARDSKLRDRWFNFRFTVLDYIQHFIIPLFSAAVGTLRTGEIFSSSRV